MFNGNIKRRYFQKINLVPVAMIFIALVLMQCNQSTGNAKKNDLSSFYEDSLVITNLISESTQAAKDDYSKGISLALEADYIANQLGENRLIILTNLHTGRLYFYKGLYEQATNYYNHALKNALVVDKKAQVARIYFYLGSIPLS
jgi:tetratricopeptide (TPR) repeat protein